MLLLLMRHGIARPLLGNSVDDFHRALTRRGGARVRHAAMGIKELVPQLDFLASGPKTRARQTAQIAREVWGKKSPSLTEWSELMDDDFAALLGKLHALQAKTDGKTSTSQKVLLCGHEPNLSRFASQILTGSADNLVFDWKKAGVCALKIEFEPPKATLLWHLTPKQARKIGKSAD